MSLKHSSVTHGQLKWDILSFYTFSMTGYLVSHYYWVYFSVSLSSPQWATLPTAQTLQLPSNVHIGCECTESTQWVWQLQLQLVSKLSRNFVLNFVRNHFPHTAPPRTNLRSLNCDFAIFIIGISGYNHLEVRVIVLSFEWTIYIYSWGQTNPLERAFHIFFSF